MKYTAVMAAILTLLGGCGSKGGNDPEKPSAGAAAKQPDSDDDDPGVTVRKEAQARAGIRTEGLAAHALQPELIAYGRLEEDPSETFVVRAPFAGALRTAPDRGWPALGETVATGSQVGRVEPRLLMTDRIGLSTQLATARAELNAGAAEEAAAQTVYDRARALNADNKNVSDKAVQDASARLAAEKAREEGVRSTIQVLESALASGAPAGQPVVAERGGEVVEALAQPGESVEQGAPLLRLARFDRLLARIDLAVGERLPPRGGAARIVPAGFEDQPGLPAEPVAVANAVDSHAQGFSLLYRLTRAVAGLRPGIAVTAHFTLPGSAGEGILVPRAAIVQQDGRTWAYVQTGEERFSRRPVPLDLPVASGFVAAKGFSAGERIVITGAQTLLSEEFKSQNEADTN